MEKKFGLGIKKKNSLRLHINETKKNRPKGWGGNTQKVLKVNQLGGVGQRHGAKKKDREGVMQGGRKLGQVKPGSKKKGKGAVQGTNVSDGLTQKTKTEPRGSTKKSLHHSIASPEIGPSGAHVKFLIMWCLVAHQWSKGAKNLRATLRCERKQVSLKSLKIS